MHVVKPVVACLLVACFCAVPGSSYAQMSLLPPTCAALNGEALSALLDRLCREFLAA